MLGSLILGRSALKWYPCGCCIWLLHHDPILHNYKTIERFAKINGRFERGLANQSTSGLLMQGIKTDHLSHTYHLNNADLALVLHAEGYVDGARIKASRKIRLQNKYNCRYFPQRSMISLRESRHHFHIARVLRT